jgi:hypothetical protein
MSIIRRIFYPEREVVVKEAHWGESPFMTVNGQLVNKLHPDFKVVEISLDVLAQHYKTELESQKKERS